MLTLESADMDDHINITYITLDGFVELDKYRYLYFVIMFTAYVLIICSNSIIVYLIWIHPNLHEPMYIFIAALSVNSVLFSSAIYPKLLMDFLSDRQIISYPACLCQWFLYYSLGGAEFLLLAAMAYDRYVSICKPLQYPTIMRRSTVCVFLALAWFLPVCQISVPAVMNSNNKLCNFTFEGIFCNTSYYRLYCERSTVRSIFGLIIFINLVLLPVIFILFTYSRILIISCRRGRDVRTRAAQTCFPHLLVLINLSCLCTYDVIIIRLGSDFPRTVQLTMTLQITLYHPLFNPIIYGLKMTEISKHLKNFLCTAKIKLSLKNEK